MFASILRQTSPTAIAPNAPKSSWKRRLAIPGVRVLAKTSTGHEAYFEQNDPHPDPLPSDGRGNRQPRLSLLPKRLDTPTDGGRFSLSHPMGEGRGEGERASKPEVVFARVLNSQESQSKRS